MKKIYTMLLCMMLLTGCSNYRELNELGLIIAMGIDHSQENNNGYRVTYQVVNPSQFSSTGDANGIPVINYSVEAKSIYEAYRLATTIIPRENNISHLSLIVIGEEVARDGLNLLFDAFERGENARTYMPVFIARGSSAEDILGVIEPIESNPTKSIISTSENNQKMYGVAKVMPVYEVISALSSEGTNLLLTGIKLNKELKSRNQTENLQDIEPSIIEINGLAIFNKDKLMNWYDREMARTAHLILSEVDSTSFPISCDGNKHITFTAKGIKSTIKTVIKPSPALQVNVTINGEIGETNCNIDISKTKVLKKLESDLEKEVINQIKQTIQFAQEAESDVFGFGNKLSKENPEYWKKHKKEWDKIFANAGVDVHVNTSIYNSGMLTDPYETK
ncbi:Ger(x)C family spore germination protein [Metabacillus dongyingensis]|uniref:Ger(x)C family spore germination protein n=1 Tax=Metabacillus dongyingensis TaxID=2874282 RepID=UPI001CC05F9A|nr:Ger(x)C family spore germination protein [Metabacillus dongyingensis]UAL54379.1 Ger(x)C family spore germination protein [Metabacillus dongyingensis]